MQQPDCCTKCYFMIETIILFGIEISLFYAFWFLGMIAALATGLLLRKEYGLSVSKCIIYISLDICMGIILTMFMSWLSGGGKMSGMNFVRIVSIAWIYFLALAYILKDPAHKILDFLTIKGVFLYVVVHIGCVFQGCCHGYPSNWGMYSNVTGYVCFPIQLIEVISNLLIGIVLLFMRKNVKYQGLLNPWYMVMFGATRLVTEFFRDNKKLLWGLSEMSLHALAALILGSIAIFVVSQRKERIK